LLTRLANDLPGTAGSAIDALLLLLRMQNHPKKLAHAQEYAEEVKEKEGMK
jgi:hypothetical protein